MELIKHKAGSTVTPAERQQRIDAARSRWAAIAGGVAGATAAGGGAAIGINRAIRHGQQRIRATVRAHVRPAIVRNTERERRFAERAAKVRRKLAGKKTVPQAVKTLASDLRSKTNEAVGEFHEATRQPDFIPHLDMEQADRDLADRLEGLKPFAERIADLRANFRSPRKIARAGRVDVDVKAHDRAGSVRTITVAPDDPRYPEAKLQTRRTMTREERLGLIREHEESLRTETDPNVREQIEYELDQLHKPRRIQVRRKGGPVRTTVRAQPAQVVRLQGYPDDAGVKALRARVLALLHDKETGFQTAEAIRRVDRLAGARQAARVELGGVVGRVNFLRHSRIALIAAAAGLGGAATLGLVHRLTRTHKPASALAKAARPSAKDRLAAALAATYRSWIDRLLGKQSGPVDLTNDMGTAMTQPLIDAFTEGATAPLIDTEGSDPSYHIDVDFDVLNPAVRRHMADYALDRIVEITAAQRDAIRLALMQQSVLQGIGPLEVARTIRESIGLTEYQQGVVQGFRSQLGALDPRVLDRKLRDKRYDPTLKRAIDTGTPLTEEQIDAMTAAYHRRMLALRAQTIARTESIRATSYGGLARAQEVLDLHPDLDVIKIWHSTDDERTRHTHVELDNKEVQGILTPFITVKNNLIRWPFDEKAVADEVINCLLPGTRVFAPDLLAATKREYNGDVITFELANSTRISCTINEPVLTDRGWSAAQFLEKGDRVICGGRQDWLSEVDDREERHPRVEDLENTLRLAGFPTTSKVTMGVDFHGEGIDGQIDVVIADNRLCQALDPTFSEHAGEKSFIGADLAAETLASQCLSDTPIGRFLLPSDSSMSAGDLRLARALGHLGPFQSLSLTAAPGSAAVFNEQAVDDRARQSVSFRERVGGRSAVVERQEFSDVLDRLSPAEADDRPLGQVPLLDASLNGRAGHPEFFRQLLVREPGLIEVSEVVSVDRGPWHGHVYNLQTRSGLYVAESAILHNCRCFLEYRFIPRRGAIRLIAA